MKKFYKKRYNTGTFLLLALLSNIAVSQDRAAQDTTQTDSVITKTIVIRWPLKKAEITPKGIKRIETYTTVLLNKSKPLRKKFKRFVPFSFWDSENQFSLNVNEVAFVNWNAGGENSVSGLANLNLTRNYKFRYVTWRNELRLRYGINVQEGDGLRKTDDFIKYATTFGYRTDTISPWYYSAKFNFNTQFSNGFKLTDRDTPISRFMAPGYLFLGAGVTLQKEKEKFVLYMSPITQKATFVLDGNLSDQGAFGVEKGERIFMEFGFLVTNTWEEEIFKNIVLNHRLTLYTDYLRSFGNVDFDWEMNFTLKVNQYVNANIGTHLIYDDDIKFDEQLAEDGTVADAGIPRVQFKQLLGVGFVYKF